MFIVRVARTINPDCEVHVYSTLAGIDAALQDTDSADVASVHTLFINQEVGDRFLRIGLLWKQA